MLTDCESRRARRESAAEESLFNLEGAGNEDCEKKIAWGYSSAGRAPALQAGGRRFDPDYLHHLNNSQSFKIRAEPSEAGLRGRGDAAK